MSVEENKAIIRRNLEEFWNQKKYEVAEELQAPDYTFHDPAAPPINSAEGYKQFAMMYHTAFPDLHFTIEDIFGEGDRVCLRWSCTGTHEGELMGIPPTGKTVNTLGNDILRIADGKIAEQWVNWSTLSMLQQLGVVPEM